MDVSSTGSMQQLQTRKMDGSGGGQGQGGGMQEIMQSLSTEDKATMKDSLSAMSQDERIATVTQLKEVDASTMSSEDYTQTLLDILDEENTNEAENEGFSVYA